MAAHGTTHVVQVARDSFSGDLLHTGVIVSTSSTFKWPVTSVLGLRREETRINCSFHRKKTSCMVANSDVCRKKKLYGGCNAQTVRATEKKYQRTCSDTIKKDLSIDIL